jgi:2-polyprenyl-3-methyl-5-hydroxy-6-metoxy-1,4-benzoquinol methylase
MDDFSIKGDVLRNTLNTLADINKWLGGNNVTISVLKKLLKNQPKHKPITIIDLGCGSGDMLRRISDYGKRQGFTFNLVGIDANKETIIYAKLLTKNYSNINYIDCDIFSQEFEALSYDLVLTTLFLHHFKDDQIVEVLSKVKNKAEFGVIVNDLHRHPVAYYLFKIVCLTIKNRMIVEDGLTSILRGFKRQELEVFSNKLQVKPQIKWKWAFRYQWIIQK